MSITAVVLLIAAHCSSPIEAGPASTTAYKVPCAIIEKDNARLPEAVAEQLAPPPPPPAVEKPAKVQKKAAARSCRKKWYVKNGHKRWRCVR